ncbi:MAG TPA: hypothetical protein VKM55_23855 [Candidatus Lokiarchaeia archaeon]|nr:hypothetical protein [Candidatus Lokiarchaeia archaeon]
MTRGESITSQAPGQAKVAIDTNVYRNIDFINYLKELKQDVSTFLPSIVFLEIGYFFASKGFSWEAYEREINKLGASRLDWSSIDDRQLIERSIEQKANLPFSDHFRDFLIGIQCETLHLDLITYNTKHFAWCQNITIMTPEMFVASRIT